jgi:hypothetical protein
MRAVRGVPDCIGWRKWHIGGQVVVQAAAVVRIRACKSMVARDVVVASSNRRGLKVPWWLTC